MIARVTIQSDNRLEGLRSDIIGGSEVRNRRPANREMFRDTVLIETTYVATTLHVTLGLLNDPSREGQPSQRSVAHHSPHDGVMLGERSHEVDELTAKEFQGDSATLTLFRSSKFTGSQMADITLDLSQSPLYLEVTDAVQDAQLRRPLEAHLRNLDRKVSPEEIGLKMVHGPEGS
jgi:hypothetical protein